MGGLGAPLVRVPTEAALGMQQRWAHDHSAMALHPQTCLLFQQPLMGHWAARPLCRTPLAGREPCFPLSPHPHSTPDRGEAVPAPAEPRASTVLCPVLLQDAPSPLQAQPHTRGSQCLWPTSLSASRPAFSMCPGPRHCCFQPPPGKSLK